MFDARSCPSEQPASAGTYTVYVNYVIDAGCDGPRCRLEYENVDVLLLRTHRQRHIGSPGPRPAGGPTLRDGARNPVPTLTAAGSHSVVLANPNANEFRRPREQRDHDCNGLRPGPSARQGQRRGACCPTQKHRAARAQRWWELHSQCVRRVGGSGVQIRRATALSWAQRHARFLTHAVGPRSEHCHAWIDARITNDDELGRQVLPTRSTYGFYR